MIQYWIPQLIQITTLIVANDNNFCLNAPYFKLLSLFAILWELFCFAFLLYFDIR